MYWQEAEAYEGLPNQIMNPKSGRADASAKNTGKIK